VSFLSPLFLVGAIAAVVPVLLHLLKRHTEQRVRFAAVALLKESELARAVLGAPFIDHYVRTREWEVRQYAKSVSDWELKRYFESI
jgi:glutamine synthetase